MESSPQDQKTKIIIAALKAAANALTETQYNALLRRDEWSESDLIRVFQPEDIEELLASIRASIYAGNKIFSRQDRDSRSFIVDAPACFFNPLIITPWLMDKEIPGISDKAIEWYKKQGKPKPAEVPPYLDTEHPLHSPELAIAIEAWQAVLQDNPDRPKVRSRKTLIENWLNINHPKLTGEAKSRIAVLLNPDKSH